MSSYSFDLQHEVPQAQMEGLQQLLQDNEIVKIMHDCRQAAAVLFYERGVTVQNVFDTQVLPTRAQQSLCALTSKDIESARDAMHCSPSQMMHDCCSSSVTAEKGPNTYTSIRY